jgi:hypothetical protein
MKTYLFISILLFAAITFPLFQIPGFGQKACKVAMSQSAFDQYRTAITSESFSSTQMEVAKQASKCFSTDQIKSVMEIFSFENDKLTFAKWAYSRCVNKDNYFTLNSGLTYSSSKSELTKFVNGQPIAEETNNEEVTDEQLQPVQPTKPSKKKTTTWDNQNQAQIPDIETENQKAIDQYNESFKQAQKQMDAFFVMTVGGDENQIDNGKDVHKPNEDETTLPAKAPRIVITEPELSQENNFTATVKSKKSKISGVISSSVGIYEVFINETEAVLNAKGEFFGDVMLAPGSNQINIKAKDTKGQIAKIGFKIVREAALDPPVAVIDVPKDEPKKEDPKPSPSPTPSAEFVSEVDQNIPKLINANKDAIAVVIGNSKYSKAKPVDFAVNDARSMKKYLINLLGFKEGNILYYENASLGDLNTVFGTKGNPKGKLFNNIKQGVSDVVVFYSGHGAPGLKDSKAYFVPVESDPNYMENSGYALDVMYENLKLLPAKSITFFSDACFSGANVFEKISPMVIRAKEPAKEGMKNTSLMNSCTGTEVSCWQNEEQHGLFTFYLLKAMKEYESTDLNKDKQISLDEIFKVVADNNEGVPYYARRQYGLTQTPVLQGSKSKILFKY